MNTPKITRASVSIKYESDDKFKYSFEAKSRPKEKLHPVVEGSKVLLDSFAELARLLELFGMGLEAEAKFKQSTEAVKKWRSLLTTKATL